MDIERDTSIVGKSRDHLAWMLAQFAFKYVATKRYRMLIEGAIRLGLETAGKGEKDA